MIYSPRTLNESRIHEVPKNNGLIFHIGEVSELWHKTVVKILMGEVSELWHKAVVNNSHVSNLSNCSVVFV